MSIACAKNRIYYSKIDKTVLILHVSISIENNKRTAVTEHLLLPRSGLVGCKDQVELLGGCCVGGLDGVDIDLARGGRVGVTEAGGDGGDRDAGVDHQRGVRMAEAVDGDVRQVVRTDEITEPTSDGIRMDWHTVRLGEQAVTVYPSVAHAEALLSLPALVLLEQLDGDSRGFDVARGAVVLGRIRDDALMRDVQRGALDADDGSIEVDILPLEATELLAAHASKHEHLDHRLELHMLAFDQAEKLSGLFLVQIAWASFFFLRQGGAFTGVGGD